MAIQPRLKSGPGTGFYDVLIDGEKVGEVNKIGTPHFGTVYYSWRACLGYHGQTKIGANFGTRRDALAALVAEIEKGRSS